MKPPLTSEEVTHYKTFTEFAQENVAPAALTWESQRGFDRESVVPARQMGFLGGTLPPDHGGLGWNATTFGLFTEAISRHSPSFAALFNVNTMVQQSVLRWGNSEQKDILLPDLASGNKLASICFTEPQAGSDLHALETSLTMDGETIEISGTKKWITCGAIADVFLVFGLLDKKPAAILIERNTPGLEVRPQRDMLGFRAANLADVVMDKCRVPRHQLLGRQGTGIQFMAPYALDWGRLCVAWSCIGMLRACAEETSHFMLKRETFGGLLIEHGSIQTLATNLFVQHEAAFLYTLQSTRSKDANRPEAPEDILAAKYLSSKVAAEQTSVAVQLFGARGCEENGPVARFYRDSKIMEIIEGSSQIIEKLLAKRFALRHSRELGWKS